MPSLLGRSGVAVHLQLLVTGSPGRCCKNSLLSCLLSGTVMATYPNFILNIHTRLPHISRHAPYRQTTRWIVFLKFDLRFFAVPDEHQESPDHIQILGPDLCLLARSLMFLGKTGEKTHRQTYMENSNNVLQGSTLGSDPWDTSFCCKVKKK